MTFLNFLQPFEKVHLVASNKSFIDDAALKQIHHVSQLKDITKVVAMPDLHPARSYPNGMIVESSDTIYPALIGGDIGCGVGLWQTELKCHKLKADKWVKSLTHKMDAESSSDNIPSQIGTIGGGNHFAELAKITWVDHEYCDLSTQQLYILVHSGSRGFGGQIQQDFLNQNGHKGIEAKSIEASQWLELQKHAIQYAQNNRQAIADKMADILRTNITLISDAPHNLLKMRGDRWLHYKGATDVHELKSVMILGSRGSASYLVQPKEMIKHTGFGIAHGAGRKWARSDVAKRIGKYAHKDLTRTALKSHVICADKKLLIEEAPEAYKNIEQVMADLIQHDLCRPVAKFEPVITFKKGRAI